MKECENCAWSYHDKSNTVLCAKTEACLSHKFWKPDYPTLEAKNAELKQRITELEKASDEFERIANKSMDQQAVLIDENNELKRELEVHKKAFEIICIHLEDVMDCPKRYPYFEEFLINCNCKECKYQSVYAKCWEEVYLEIARKELSHD